MAARCDRKVRKGREECTGSLAYVASLAVKKLGPLFRGDERSGLSRDPARPSGSSRRAEHLDRREAGLVVHLLRCRGPSSPGRRRAGWSGTAWTTWSRITKEPRLRAAHGSGRRSCRPATGRRSSTSTRAQATRSPGPRSFERRAVLDQVGADRGVLDHGDVVGPGHLGHAAVGVAGQSGSGAAGRTAPWSPRPRPGGAPGPRCGRAPAARSARRRSRPPGCAPRRRPCRPRRPGGRRCSASGGNRPGSGCR